MNAPFAAVMGYILLGETLSGAKLIGAAVAFGGMILAIAFGGSSNHRFEAIRGSLAVLIGLGLIAATSNAVGLVLLKPALLGGTDPLALDALRTLGGSLTISLVALWPATAFAPEARMTPGLLLHTLTPAVLGFIIAVSLQLYALKGTRRRDRRRAELCSTGHVTADDLGNHGRTPSPASLARCIACRGGNRLDPGWLIERELSLQVRDIVAVEPNRRYPFSVPPGSQRTRRLRSGKRRNGH